MESKPEISSNIEESVVNVEEPEQVQQEAIFEPNSGPQTDFLSAPEQEVLYGGAAGGGKIVYEHQSVLTPSGWTNIKDLEVGTQIIGADGKAQTITHLFAWETLPVWQVEFDDGTVIDTAEEHLWNYWIAGNGQKRSHVKSTKGMWEHSQRVGRSAIIPTVKEVEFVGQDAPVDPYTLGAMLGDGCMVNKSITFTSHEDDIAHWKENLAFCENDLKIEGQTIRVVGDSRLKFVDYLLSVGLIPAKSNSKFIPEEFLITSVPSRKAVLQGLMDTDGYRDPERARAEYSTVSGKLAEGVKFLAQSLGYRVSVYHKVGSYKNKTGDKVECQKVYRLYITGKNVDTIFRMKRKRSGVIGKQTGRRVVDVRRTDRQAVGRCITVSNSDGLYITDDFIVTHNSYAMVADPVRYFDNPYFNGLLLRRTTEELRELISISKLLYPQVFPGARFVERDKTWYFPSGAKLWMSYLERDDDVLRYQGQAYTWIGFDELTQWPTPFAWNYLRSRLRRTSAANLPVYMRATANPGGPGHQWVKKMFIDPAPPGQPFWGTDIDTGNTLVFPEGHSKAGKPLLKRRFIPATLFDNPYLAEDGMYEANLLSMPEHQRKQLLEGDWNVNEGAAFPEWSNAVHVVEPFEIPKSWTKFRACDYGYGSASGVVWFAITPSEQLIVYRELYVSGVEAVKLAEMIMEIEEEAGERIRHGVLDSSLWHKRGDTGPSLAEKMNAIGTRFRPSDRSAGSRVAGKNEFHRRLQIDPYTEEPRMVFFSTCRHCISQIPSLPLDKNNPEDVDTKSEDHLYDAIRYGIMTRPRSSIWDYDPMGNNGRQVMSDPVFGY